VQALDLVIPEGRVPAARHPFKGNIDLRLLEAVPVEHGPAGVPPVMITF